MFPEPEECGKTSRGHLKVAVLFPERKKCLAVRFFSWNRSLLLCAVLEGQGLALSACMPAETHLSTLLSKFLVGV